MSGLDLDPMLTHKPRFLYWNQYFPKFYVKKIVDIVKEQRFYDAKLAEPEQIDQIRKSQTNQFFGPSWENIDLRLILLETLKIISWANSFYNFDIDNENEKSHEVQLTKYTDDGSFYSWHTDKDFLFKEGQESLQRKLSSTIILQEAEEGGIFDTEYGTDGFDQKAGSIFVFPSFYSHQVTPVTKGERLSIVSWTCGPEWK